MKVVILSYIESLPDVTSLATKSFSDDMMLKIWSRTFHVSLVLGLSQFLKMTGKNNVDHLMTD
jgi:hypothetical protein